MIFMTKNKLRKVVDEILEERKRRVSDLELAGFRNPAPEPEDLEIVTVRKRDPEQKLTLDEPISDVYVTRAGGPRYTSVGGEYEQFSKTTLTTILTQILCALRAVGVEVVQTPPRFSSWGLRKNEPAAKERAK